MLSELVRQVKPVELIPITEGEVRALFPVIGRDPIADIKNEIPFTYTEEELAQYHTLDVGDRSADVLALRKRLYALGYYTKPNENPLYTESTADVIEMFQADCGLEETGVADPYTQALLAAIPVIDITRRGKRIETIQGEVVSPINPAPGCRFAPRCKYASEECHQPQELRDMGNGHFVACMKK